MAYDRPVTRKVVLREERSGIDKRNLWAWVDGKRRLHIDGQDLGPGTRSVSDDGEYEWTWMIEASDLPRLLELLGGNEQVDVLDFLEERYSGEGSYELERILGHGDTPASFARW